MGDMTLFKGDHDVVECVGRNHQWSWTIRTDVNVKSHDRIVGAPDP